MHHPKRKLILASASRRRYEILQNVVGNNFDVMTGDFEENTVKHVPAEILAKHNARGKARSVFNRVHHGIIIAADTLIFVNGKILGKPKNPEDARQMLKKISGKLLHAYTAIAVIDVDNKMEKVECETIKIHMSKISDKEIETYIETGEIMDKAGAISAMEIGSLFIQKVDGDFLGFVGLPIFRLNQMLKKMGINLLDYRV